VPRIAVVMMFRMSLVHLEEFEDACTKSVKGVTISPWIFRLFPSISVTCVMVRD